MKNLKLHWGFALAAFVLGGVISFFVFRCKVETNNSVIQYLEEDVARLTKDYDSVVRYYHIKDSLAAIEVKKEESTINEIKENAKRTIEKGVDAVRYDALVRSNRARGRQRSPD